MWGLIMLSMKSILDNAFKINLEALSLEKSKRVIALVALGLEILARTKSRPSELNPQVCASCGDLNLHERSGSQRGHSLNL